MFKNLSTDERKLEYMQKSMQMGQWNIGLQKGVYKYDKKFDEKNTLLFELVVGEGDEPTDLAGNAGIGMEVNEEMGELRQDEEGSQNEFNMNEDEVDYYGDEADM